MFTSNTTSTVQTCSPRRRSRWYWPCRLVSGALFPLTLVVAVVAAAAVIWLAFVDEVDKWTYEPD